MKETKKKLKIKLIRKEYETKSISMNQNYEENGVFSFLLYNCVDWDYKINDAMHCEHRMINYESCCAKIQNLVISKEIEYLVEFRNYNEGIYCYRPRAPRN